MADLSPDDTPQTLHPKPQTPNLKPQTQNRKADRGSSSDEDPPAVIDVQVGCMICAAVSDAVRIWVKDL